MSIRVLHVYSRYFPDSTGGVEEAIRQITSTTRKFEIESQVFCLSKTSNPKEIIYQGINVVRDRSHFEIGSCAFGGVSAFKRFAALAKWAQVINYHFPWPFADLLHLGVRPEVPTVLTYHSDVVKQRFLNKIYSPLRYLTLSSMNSIIATSPNYAKTSPVLSNQRFRNKVQIIPLGIEERVFRLDPKAKTLKDFGLEDNEPFFLFIGILRYYKNVQTLIEASVKLPVKVVIAGSGPEESILRNQALKLGLDNVIFTGYVTNCEKDLLLRRCHGLVLPSHLRSEAFGMVLVEAAMFGKPMISCEIGTGTSFINIDGETGFVIPPQNSAKLAQAMHALINDEELALSFGKTARLRYETYFSGDTLGRSYADLYKELTN